jgi:dihydroorotase
MLFRNADLADGRTRDVRVTGERVAAVATDLAPEPDERVVDAADRLLLPGMVDAHVHFREPGFPHKETWTTGSRAAAAGGVTTVVDQPNTDPPTTAGDRFDAKADLAAASLVDYGINGGVVEDWAPDSLFDRPLFALGEVFLADSTGEMGIDADLFADAVARAAREDVTVTVHAEDATLFDSSVRPGGEHERHDGRESDALASTQDARPVDADAWSAYRTPEAEAAAVERACEVAAGVDAALHVAHTSTPEGIDLAADAGATCEVTPHHLLLSRADLDELGTFGRMNPPLRSEARRAAVFERVADGTVDIVATDHAPHTRAEKDAGIWDAPSGVPGVETALPLLLGLAATGDLTHERVRDLTAATPAAVFDLPRKGRVAEGYDADLTLVDPDAVDPVRAERLHGMCDWTPFEGFDAVFPELTLVRGTVVYERDGDCFGDPVGENVRDS